MMSKMALSEKRLFPRSCAIKAWCSIHVIFVSVYNLFINWFKSKFAPILEYLKILLLESKKQDVNVLFFGYLIVRVIKNV